MSKCSWPLGNGKTLEFDIYTHDTSWNQVAGLYIFAHLINSTEWKAIYVGQADAFSTRIPNHEKWDLARLHGATHVHALVVPQSANRDILEQLLIASLRPPLNKQHKTAYRQTGS